MVIDTYSYYEKTFYVQSYGSDIQQVWNAESIENDRSACQCIVSQNMAEYSPGKKCWTALTTGLKTINVVPYKKPSRDVAR